jgi:hypothetical protein
VPAAAKAKCRGRKNVLQETYLPEKGQYDQRGQGKQEGQGHFLVYAVLGKRAMGARTVTAVASVRTALLGTLGTLGTFGLFVLEHLLFHIFVLLIT